MTTTDTDIVVKLNVVINIQRKQRNVISILMTGADMISISTLMTSITIKTNNNIMDIDMSSKSWCSL